MRGGACGWFVAALLGGVLLPDPARGGVAGQRVTSLVASGNLAAAQAVLDSLLRADPADLEVGFLAADMREQRGRAGEARDLWLQLEAVAAGSDLGLLALRRRIDLERAQADAVAIPPGKGAASGQASAARRVALVPLENLGDADPGAGFGLAWSYLLADALAGSPIEPVAMPSLLVLQGQLSGEGIVRARAQVEHSPINTVRGLEARLRSIADPAGLPYLEETEGALPEGAIDAAVARFRADVGLAPREGVDLETQRALEEQLRRRLMTPPRPLPPAALGSLMQRTGATIALRGTYEVSEGQITVRYAWIDAEGAEILQARTRSFDHAGAGDEALAAAAELARSFRVEIGGASRVAAGPELLGAVTMARLLIDRGLLDLGGSQLQQLGDGLAAWPAARRLQAALVLPAAEVERQSARLLPSLAARMEIAPRAELHRLVSLLGLAGSGALTDGGDPVVRRVLGGQGMLHVHVEGP